ncbi:hypothetical protein HMPREF2999_06835 [Rothia sp. HMSC066H02]|uniref:hypothetical protein n=1 Tax=unclassified Rothia (in: high G+C Gram-positive bacteria) TaxID=2689056 RepID=UPI0008A39A07|nr:MULTISPECIES: hypothetical protein [unclassified Rothia (in: high G+C Gram-positive bacteria)]OFO97225.1 hypothetical protein HMPREF3008_07920 [Rothia sp. HMSC065D09]OFP13329.1 hypothetical protein HMPREF2999_06835 [Rothia sp. HMSC066H02]
MTATNPKTKRDRAAGRTHRHTAIQTIIDNHNQVRTDIDSLDNSVAVLQDEVCESRRLTDHLNGRVAQHTKDVNANVGFAMQCVVENERKLTETECAVGILQGASKNQGKALAQLDRYTKRLHAKQTNLNHDLTITRIDIEDMEKKFITLAWINLGLWVAAALTIFILLLLI